MSRRLDRLARSNKSIEFTATTAEVAALFNLLADPQVEQPTTASAARTATEVHATFFLVAAAEPGTIVRAQVDETVFEIEGTGKTTYLHLASWFELYWWKAMSRSEVAAAAAGRFELTELTADGRWGEHRLHLFRAFRSRDVGDPQWTSHLADAARALEQPISVFPEEADLLDRGVIEILAAVAEGDQGRLTDSIDAALVAHRTYWTKSAERREDCRGFSSLPIAAAAAIAVDEGMTVEVESDYLAMGLVRPGWFSST
ncbi:hypothetical protein ASG12_06495 [Williamsia sp. Leaf354]|nr:hypothetical protein ASG12_06495 [Williamsia sp. Leaf354]